MPWRLFAGVVVVALVVAIWMGRSNTQGDRPQKASKPQEVSEAGSSNSVTPVLPQKKDAKAFEELIQKPQNLDVAVLSKAPQVKISPECGSLFNEINGFDLRSWNSESSWDELPPDSGCGEKTLPPRLEILQTDYKSICLGTSKEAVKDLSEEERKALCGKIVLAYRARLIEQQYLGVPLSEINDPQVLANILIARDIPDDPSAFRSESHLDGVLEVAHRFLELEPDFVAVANFGAGVALKKTQDSATKNPKGESDPVWQQAEAWLERSEEMDPENSGLDQTKLWIESRGFNVKHLSAALDSLQREKPNSEIIPYHRALQEWQLGNQEGAIEMFERQAKEQGAESHAAYALESIRAGNGVPYGAALDQDFHQLYGRSGNAE